MKDNNIPATIVCQMPLYSLGEDVLSKISDKNMVCFYSEDTILTTDNLLKTENLLDLLVKILRIVI